MTRKTRRWSRATSKVASINFATSAGFGLVEGLEIPVTSLCLRILFGMNTTEILSAIDEEMSRLTQVRSLLGGLDTAAFVPERLTPNTTRQRGRPKGSKNKATSFDPTEFSVPKRPTMSPEGKARIAAAQRARWVRQHAEAMAPRAQKKSTADPAARVNQPSKSPSKVSSVTKRPMTAVKAPARSLSMPRSRTRSKLRR